MLAPQIEPVASNPMRTNLPKRDELLLRIVWALPNASRIGLVAMIWSARSGCSSPIVGNEEEEEARNWMTRFVFSVLPAPDSPVMRML